MRSREFHKDRFVNQLFPALLLCVTCFISLASTVHGQAPEADKELMSAVRIKTLLQSTIETILQKHIEPPTRQQLVFEVVRQLEHDLKKPMALDLGVTISDTRSSEELYDFVASELKKQDITEVSTRIILQSVSAGISRILQGGLEFDTRSNAKAMEQIAANRYVGIGVSISDLGQGKGKGFSKVFEDGTAFVAGILEGDILESVDGNATHTISLTEVIQLLRGPVDTTVNVTVRTKVDAPRELKLVRRVIPLKSLQVIEKSAVDKALLIRVHSITASSLGELQNSVAKAESDGEEWNTVVLDIQDTNVSNLHFFHLFADGLLDGGVLCKVQTRGNTISLNTEDGQALDNKRVTLLYNPGRSEALDILAQACDEAGKTVLYWFVKPDAFANQQSIAEQPVMESFEAAGTDYQIMIATSRLLNKRQSSVPFPAPNQKPEQAAGKPLVRRTLSDLESVLLEVGR
jgi:C-terminal processing protease CtpA/Prc